MGRSAMDGVSDGEWSVFAMKVAEERDNWKKIAFDLVPEDMTCKPDGKCDGLAHDDDCPLMSAANANAALKAEVERLRMADVERGNAMGRIAIALSPDRNNISDEELVARAAEIGYALTGAQLRAEKAEAERDAYKKAKAENDERFMLERDALKAENERLRYALLTLQDLIALCKAQGMTVTVFECAIDAAKGNP